MSSPLSRFYRFCDKLQKSDNGSKSNRLNAFLYRLGKSYRIPSDEAQYLGLIAIWKTANRRDDVLESYLCLEIRNTVKDYARNRSNFSNKLLDTAAEMDDLYLVREDDAFDNVELKCDVQKILTAMGGKAWRLCNLIMRFGEKKMLFYRVLKINRYEYAELMREIKYVFNYYNYSYV